MGHHPEIPSYKITELASNSREEKDFEFYRFELFAKNIDHLKRPHRHDHFALFFVTSGEGSHLIDLKQYELTGKRVFLIAPGQVHAWQTIKGVKGYVLLFSRDFFTITLQYQELRSYLFDNMVYQRPCLDLDTESYQHLESIFISIENEGNRNRKYGKNIVRSYINIILFEITRSYERDIPVQVNNQRGGQLVKSFNSMVNKHYKTNPTVSYYAGQLGITPNYLNSVCKKYKGKSASDIIHDRVILEAKRLLTHSDKTVAQIAYDLSFEDNSYFGRFFKKHTGFTPAKFRYKVKA
jgi:AraC-like DNA-binding protein